MSCNIVIWWNTADDKGKHHLKKHEGRGGGSSTECYTVPFPHTYFRTFNCCKCTIFKLWIQTESQRFLDFFTGLKCSFWPLWTFSQIEMTDFPILSYTSTCKISTLSYAWSLKRVLFSDGTSPYRPLLGVPPPPPTREEALSFVLWFSVFINTVLPLYYYKVSSGSWRPVRSARWVNINKTDFNPSWRLPFLLRDYSSGSFQQLINVVYTSKHIAVFCERKPVLLIRNTRLTLYSVPPSYYDHFRTLCTF